MLWVSDCFSRTILKILTANVIHSAESTLLCSWSNASVLGATCRPLSSSGHLAHTNFVPSPVLLSSSLTSYSFLLLFMFFIYIHFYTVASSLSLSSSSSLRLLWTFSSHPQPASLKLVLTVMTLDLIRKVSSWQQKEEGDLKSFKHRVTVWEGSSNVKWYAATSFTLKLLDPLMTTPLECKLKRTELIAVDSNYLFFNVSWLRTHPSAQLKISC